MDRPVVDADLALLEPGDRPRGVLRKPPDLSGLDAEVAEGRLPLWLGLSGSGMFLLWTGILGGVFCLMLLFARFHSRPYLYGAPGWVRVMGRVVVSRTGSRAPSMS